jgi:sulfonate transport system substrate-binding protein
MTRSGTGTPRMTAPGRGAPEGPWSAPNPWAAFALLVVAGLASCHHGSARGEPPSSAPDGGDLAEITLRVGDQSGLTRSILESAGELTTPYRIEWTSFTAGPPMLEAISANAIDVGACGDAPPLFALAAGASIRIVGALRASPEFEVILAPAGSALAHVADLRGKKVAVAKGSAAHHLLLAALKREGLTMGDIRPVYLTPNDAQPAFTHGDVDAWAIWDPFATNNLRQGAVKLTDGRGLSHGLAFEVAGTAALGDPGKTRALADYLSRLARAQNWGNSHPDLWAAKYSAITKLPLDLTLAVLGHFRPQFVPLDDALLAEEQEIEDTFVAGAVLPSRLDVTPLFDTRFNEAVARR